MWGSKFKGFIKSGLVIFSVLFLVGFDVPKVKNVNIKDKAKIKQGQQTPAPTTDVILTDVPAGGAFKGFYYAKPEIFGDELGIVIQKRKLLKASWMNTCDYVVYEGDSVNVFGPEVGNFINSKRNFPPIAGSVSALSKGHLDICRNLFGQTSVADFCESANLGGGMSGGDGGGRYNFPDLLQGGGAGQGSSGRFSSSDIGQGRFGQRPSGGQGSGRPSFGDLLRGGGDAGAGSFLWNYDPCSNDQACSASGGGGDGLWDNSVVAGFTRAIFSIGGGRGGGDPRMEDDNDRWPERRGRAEWATSPQKGDPTKQMNFQTNWTVNAETGRATFRIHISCNFNCMKTGWAGTMTGSCDLKDPECAKGINYAYQASRNPQYSGIFQRGAASTLYPKSDDQATEEQRKCDENPDDPKCVKRREEACQQNPDTEQCKKDRCAENPSAPECKEKDDSCQTNPSSEECKDFCEKNPNDPDCKPEPKSKGYPPCDALNQSGCDGNFAIWLPFGTIDYVANTIRFDDKWNVSYPSPEGGGTASTDPSIYNIKKEKLDPLGPVINPDPEKVGGGVLSAESSPCGGLAPTETKGTITTCPEGTAPSPSGCRPTGGVGPGGIGIKCSPGMPNCPTPPGGGLGR